MIYISDGIWNDGPEPISYTEFDGSHPVQHRHICHGGGKGSSGSSQPQQVTSTTTTSNLPEYARPYFESLMRRAQGTSNQGYQPYGGQRLADFTQPQQWAFQQANQAVNTWQPSWAAASGLAGQAGEATVNQASNTYDAQGLTPQNWIDSGVSESYMSPYMQNVTDIGKREALRDYNIQAQQRNAQAEQAGAFGGYRHGIMEAEANRNLNQQLQDIQTRGLQSAYETGLGAFSQDRAAQIGANQLNNQFAQQESQLGMQATGMNNEANLALARNQLAAAQMQAGLGQAWQGQQLQDIQTMLGIGGMQQAQQQAGLDIGYQDFLNQRDYERQNLNWLSGILRGVPVSANSSVANYQQPPNQLSQLTGLGLGAAGLMKMMQ